MCIDAIKSFEGLRLKAYKPVPTEKFFTIGYGSCGPHVGRNMVIDESMATFLLRRDIAKVEGQLNALKLNITQSQFDALVDFVYNLGFAALQKSTLLKKIRAKRPNTEIQAEFRKWVYAGGKKLAGLIKRREWEAQMWVTW